MTAPRIARAAGRSRIFVLLGFLIFMIGFITIFQNSQQHQLEELKQIITKCEQQQQAISSEMQGVLEQKLRLENAVVSQKHLYDQTKIDLESRAKEEKDMHTKSNSEASLRFASLQQHFKLTKSELDDLQEECSLSKQKQMEEINGLQGKVKSLQSQLIQIGREKDKEIENWKAKYNQLENTNQKLEKSINKNENTETDEHVKLKIHILEKKLETFKKMCPHVTEDVESDVVKEKKISKIDRNFHEQKAVSDVLYKIDITSNNHTNSNTNNKLNSKSNIENIYINNNNKKPIDNGIINSVENFQIIPKMVDNNNNQNNVLLQPFDIRTSTPSSSPSNSNNINNNDIPQIASNSNKQTVSTKNIGSTKKVKTLPLGVVPIPDNMKDFINNKNNNDNLSDDNNNKNRYSNVLSAINTNVGDKHSDNDINNNKNLDFPNIVNEQENGANEEHDNEFDIDDKNKKYPNNKEHANINNLDLDKINNNNIKNNNNAEEDLNLYENNKNLFVQNNHKESENDIDGGLVGGGANKFDDNKLHNEIAGDHGKEGVNYDEDIHLDQDHLQNEEEDVDEYDDPKALKQGHAERN